MGITDRLMLHCLVLGLEPAEALAKHVFRLLFFPNGMESRGLEPGAIVIYICPPKEWAA